MRIINVYVKSFGKLKNFSQSFNDGFNAIKEDNGSGKTTLAAFIKAMFYGFDGVNKRSVAENERKKYTPWGERRFGGYIDFELRNGKTYRVERYFEANDSTFTLYDLKTKMISRDYTNNIGYELFGVDREGYERTTYYPQTQVEQKPNTTISAKLTSLTYNTNDLTSFDDAIKVLDDKRKELSSATQGEIVKLKERIKKGEEKLTQCEEAKLSHDKARLEKVELDERLKVLNAKLEVLQKEKEANLKQEAQREINKTFERMRADITKCENELGDLIAFFKGVEVLEDDVKTINEKIVNVKTFEKSKLAENQNVVKEKQELEKFFKGNVLTLEQLDEKLNGVNNQKQKVEVKSSKNNILIICAAVLGLVGLGLIFVELIAGIIAIVLAFALGFVYMFTYLKSLTIADERKTPSVALIRFLSNYFDDIEDTDECISILKTNIMKYNALNLIDENNDSSSYESDKKQLKQFFAQFFEDDEEDFANKLYIIESKKIEKQNKIKELEARKQELEKELRDL